MYLVRSVYEVDIMFPGAKNVKEVVLAVLKLKNFCIFPFVNRRTEAWWIESAKFQIKKNNN